MRMGFYDQITSVILGVQWGAIRYTKAYLSETFRCSIYEIARVILGCSMCGGGGSKVTKGLSLQNVRML